MEGYGVSNQCMALVRDNCLIPTKDAPELGYIRESTDKQYVPDVYYKVSTWHYYSFAWYVIRSFLKHTEFPPPPWLYSP
jgi:hypothetical protein